MGFYCRWARRLTRWHPQTHTASPPAIKLSNWSLVSHTLSLQRTLVRKNKIQYDQDN